jgi:hypothetical protein
MQAKKNAAYWAKECEKLDKKMGIKVGDADQGTVDGAMVVRHMRYTQSRFDQEKFKEAYPDLFEKFQRLIAFDFLRLVS